MKVFFTRHGETEWTRRDIILGREDIPLNETGRAQAAALAQRIEDEKIPIDVIICSPLSRTLETAGYCARKLDIDVITDQKLIEWDFGEYEGKDRHTPGYQQAKGEFAVRLPGGESVFDVVTRVYSLLDELPRKYPGKNVLLVCHGGVCRIIECYARGLTHYEFMHFFMGNCELRSYDPQDISVKR